MAGSTTLLLCQPATGLSRHERLERIATVLATPTATAHRIAVFPELFLSGYSESLADAAIACARDEDALAQIQRLCAEHASWAVVGAVAGDRHGFYNASVCIDAEGARRALHHKCRLFGDAEAAVFLPGSRPTLFDSPLGRTAMAICFDIEDPLLMRDYRDSGAQVVLAPTANMRPYDLVPGVTVRARALDNGLTIAYANFAGPEASLDFLGDSIVVGPDGRVLGALGPRPGLLAIELAGKDDAAAPASSPA